MNRNQIERMIVEEATKRLMSIGWNPAYHDATDDGEVEAISTLPEVIEAVFSVDECRVWFKKEGMRHQHVFFVLGNDGYDVICDHTCPAEDRPEHDFVRVMGSVDTYADELRSKYGKL